MVKQVRMDVLKCVKVGQCGHLKLKGKGGQCGHLNYVRSASVGCFEICRCKAKCLFELYFQMMLVSVMVIERYGFL